MNRKFFFGWLAFVATLAGLAALGWHWLDSGLDFCEDTVTQQAISPDARLKAFVYNRSCGVFSTGFTTQVAIVKNGEDLPREAGNVYIERSEDSQPQVSVQWQGNQSLRIMDDPRVTGRVAEWTGKRVPVNLGWHGWFRSADVAIRYINFPLWQKTTK